MHTLAESDRSGSRARPKSTRRRVPSSASSTLAHLRSRWMIPRRWQSQARRFAPSRSPCRIPCPVRRSISASIAANGIRVKASSQGLEPATDLGSIPQPLLRLGRIGGCLFGRWQVRLQTLDCDEKAAARRQGPATQQRPVRAGNVQDRRLEPVSVDLRCFLYGSPEFIPVDSISAVIDISYW